MKKAIFTLLIGITLTSFNASADLTVLCTGKHYTNGTTVKLLVDNRGVQSIVHYTAGGEQYGDVVYPTTPMTTEQFRLYCERSNYIAGC